MAGQSNLSNGAKVAIGCLHSVGAHRVLDFGCGTGAFVETLCDQGFDAYGCDIGHDWPEDGGLWTRGRPATEWQAQDRLRAIASTPYRLPFETNSFDAVVSLTVFEHIQDKTTALAEIDRILKPGGVSFHQFPSRWVLPLEPHTNVPLASWFKGAAPLWWWRLWAYLGIRNEFQRGKSAGEVALLNHDYAKANLHYLSKPQYESLNLPGLISWPDSLALELNDSLTSRIAKKIRLSPEIVALFRNRTMKYSKIKYQE